MSVGSSHQRRQKTRAKRQRHLRRAREAAAEKRRELARAPPPPGRPTPRSPQPPAPALPTQRPRKPHPCGSTARRPAQGRAAGSCPRPPQPGRSRRRYLASVRPRRRRDPDPSAVPRLAPRSRRRQAGHRSPTAAARPDRPQGLPPLAHLRLSRSPALAGPPRAGGSLAPRVPILAQARARCRPALVLTRRGGRGGVRLLPAPSHLGRPGRGGAGPGQVGPARCQQRGALRRSSAGWKGGPPRNK